MKNFKLRMPGDKVCNKRVLEYAHEIGFRFNTSASFPSASYRGFLYFRNKEIIVCDFYREYEEITLAEYFALKPEPVFPMTFDDCLASFNEKNIKLPRFFYTYKEIDIIKQHADEIREMMK